MYRSVQDYRTLLRRKRIVVIQSGKRCKEVLRTIRMQCRYHKYLGFDAEWVTVNGCRDPIALLQISTANGLCALVRLCKMNYIPRCLIELLEDPNIIKVGVAPRDDAIKLFADYGINVKSTLDLRFLAAMTGWNTGGLAKLSKSILNIEMEKNFYIRCSNWQSDRLTQRQIQYAAADAFIAGDIFNQLTQKLFTGADNMAKAYEHLSPYLDVTFNEARANEIRRKKAEQEQMKLMEQPQKQQLKSHSFRQQLIRQQQLDEVPCCSRNIMANSAKSQHNFVFF